MEEIKIRVWDKEENRMISGDRFAFEEYAPLNDLFNNNSKKFDFMLYTGYKDINGKEIYDGDIIEYEHHAVGKIKRAVRIKYGIWGIKGKQEHLQIPFANIFDAEFEVIGNVYENKNLLEEE